MGQALGGRESTERLGNIGMSDAPHAADEIRKIISGIFPILSGADIFSLPAIPNFISNIRCRCVISKVSNTRI